MAFSQISKLCLMLIQMKKLPYVPQMQVTPFKDGLLLQQFTRHQWQRGLLAKIRWSSLGASWSSLGGGSLGSGSRGGNHLTWHQ